MHKPTLGRDRAIDFQATPMIDVVFLLIIFFLVSSHLASQEAPSSVNLPEATAVDQALAGRPFGATIDVAPDGRLLWDQTPVTVEQATQRLADELAGEQRFGAVRIRADRTTPYGEVEALLLACRQAGITEAAFAVVEAPREASSP